MPRALVAIARSVFCLAIFDPGRLVEVDRLRGAACGDAMETDRLRGAAGGDAMETAAGPAANPSRMLKFRAVSKDVSRASAPRGLRDRSPSERAGPAAAGSLKRPRAMLPPGL